MTDIDMQDLAHRAAGPGSHSLRSPWPLIGSVTRTAAVIAALMLVASVPLLLRLWLFFPTIHN
jgi:hypothetical protein